MKPLLLLDFAVVGVSLFLSFWERRRGNRGWQRMWLAFAAAFLFAAGVTMVRT